MEVHYVDETYRPDDGVRDPFGWARFGNGKFLVGGCALLILAVIVMGRDPQANVVAEAYETAGHVVGTAVRAAEAAGGR